MQIAYPDKLRRRLQRGDSDEGHQKSPPDWGKKKNGAHNPLREKVLFSRNAFPVEFEFHPQSTGDLKLSLSQLRASPCFC